MDEKEMKELMIDYIDGKLTGELKTYVEKHIARSIDNQKEFESLRATMQLLEADRELEPDSHLRLDFLEALDKEVNRETENDTKGKGILFRLPVFRQLAAAVALLVVGVLGGVWFMQNRQNDRQLQALQREMENTKKMVMTALDDQNSASERMLGVNASFEMTRADDDIVRVLVKTMNEDENVNVRLAAINALAKFSGEAEVRRALIASLAVQTDPLVQITLINLMVEMKEKGAVQQLKEIIKDSTNIESVKDEAHMAVFKLS